ncbi:MAG TPA: sodium-translocating pyrophosphatase, partial [Alphaproteobacteria bacterium]|nr:sodium-translocating pyrophosphatase [Alphaproteobacteria bacterium]
MFQMKKIKFALAAAISFLLTTASASASEIDLNVPTLDVPFNIFGFEITGSEILACGLAVCAFGMLFGLWEFLRIKKMPAHEAMLKVSETIYATCKTYMKQQAKLLFVLECFIGVCIFYYFFYLNNTPLNKVLNILLWSVLGILGSYLVAWFGMRINTYANARTSFASLKGKAFDVMSLPLHSGMSIGVL